MTRIQVEVLDDEPGPDVAKWWWVFLLTGIVWILVSFAILAFDPTSAVLIAFIVGVVLIGAGINEFVEIGFAEGWKWLHAVLGVLFVIAGILAFVEPFQIFGILALLIGWYLLIKGTFEVVISIMGRHEISLWGLLLAAGIIQIMIGVWAIGYPGRSAALLILWVGIGALMRGITEIFFAFRLRGERGAGSSTGASPAFA
jgi:uncharacterized membrane protein HdeD (DUF308 family)